MVTRRHTEEAQSFTEIFIFPSAQLRFSPENPCMTKNKNNMETRKFNAEDMGQLWKLHSVVYNFRRNFNGDKPPEPDPLANPPEWSWGVFEGKKLLAGMTELEYLMTFDGHKAKMSGISGVGTLPESRHAGCVRRIFEKLLPEAYEKGVVFSNLTPFSHEFYRKFGYETACARNQLSLNAKDFVVIKPKGEFVQVFPGDDTSALAKIHSSYITGLNHGISRDYWPDNRAWKIYIRDDPYTTGNFLYVWRDEKGRARSYIKYQDVTEEGAHNMSVWELVYMDKDALYGALGIVAGLAAQFKKVKWMMPTFIDPFDFVGDSWSVGSTLTPRDMTRVVNVAEALCLMRRPEGEGAYIAELADDPHVPANKGKYRVEFGAGITQVKRTAKKADITCDLLTLAQLVTGYRSLENAMITRKNGLVVNGNLETLKRVFTARPQHVTEYF